jgi:hypothetical protein
MGFAKAKAKAWDKAGEVEVLTEICQNRRPTRWVKYHIGSENLLVSSVILSDGEAGLGVTAPGCAPRDRRS